jgi:Tfp pilus assembly protein FimT
MAELVVVCAILGVLVSTSVPFYLSYYHSAAVKAAAEELATHLNQGRQLAIKENKSVCVHTRLTGIHFHVPCGAARWVGPGTDSLGNLKPPPGILFTDSADLVFNYLGAASPASTYTVTNTTTSQTLNVTVAASGRIRIGP